MPTPESPTASAPARSRQSRRTRITNMATSSAGTSDVSSTFSVCTNLRMKELSDNSCWVCGAPYPRIAQMIAKDDRQAALWLERGLINFSLTSVANAIALCGTCHIMFGCALDPGVSLNPTDIRFFLDSEKKDRERRRHASRDGKVAIREVPTADMYKAHQILYVDLTPSAIGGLYEPVFLQRYLAPHVSVDITEELRVPHEWHGAPLAALRRCFPLLGSGRIGALSKKQRLELQELRDLYFLDEE
ncbi:hypothetical protein BO94DRAFT_493456, partial [Aspergillus sclerotioniger CBS 115572]